MDQHTTAIDRPCGDRVAYSVDSAATALSIGRTKLYALIREGRLPVLKIGTRTLIRCEDLRKLAAHPG